MKIITLFAHLSLGRLAIASIFLTAVYYLVSFDSGSALTEQINGVKAQIGVERARRADIEKTMKKEEEMRGNLLQLARNLEVLKSKIPNEFKDTEMSSLVNQVAMKSDIRIVVLSRVQTPQAVKKQGAGAELVEEIVFEISATGSFAQLIHFVEQLSKEEKVIKVRNFTIEKNSTNVDDNAIRFKGDVVGFKQAAVIAQPTPAGGRK